MILQLLGISIAVLVSIPLVVLSTQCLIALCFNTKSLPCTLTSENPVSFKILIPAHNEACIIGKTLAKLIAELPGQNPEEVVLVADNCTDDTANIARSMGVTVLERHDAIHRGKGFALDFGIQYIRESNRPDVLVLMDADCETTESALISLINAAAEQKLPAQMTYIMRVIENADIRQKIAGFAWLLINKIRPLAMHRLGLSATLTGTGMAFPCLVLDTIKMGHDDIVENMQLSIDCTINGFPPVFCPEAVVYSDFPEHSSAEMTQRTRWEHGHLQTILKQLPVLIKASWQRKDWRLFALALNLGVPPLSLLVMITLGGIGVLATFLLITETATAFFVLLFSFFYFVAMLACVWWRYGRDYLSTKELTGIPFYILSKLSIYTAFIFNRQKEWVRTGRNG